MGERCGTALRMGPLGMVWARPSGHQMDPVLGTIMCVCFGGTWVHGDLGSLGRWGVVLKGLNNSFRLRYDMRRYDIRVCIAGYLLHVTAAATLAMLWSVHVDALCQGLRCQEGGALVGLSACYYYHISRSSPLSPCKSICHFSHASHVCMPCSKRIP